MAKDRKLCKDIPDMRNVRAYQLLDNRYKNIYTSKKIYEIDIYQHPPPISTSGVLSDNDITDQT